MTIVFCLRHFETSVDPEKPASEWTLSEAGKKALEEFIEEDFLSSVGYIHSSPESKGHKAAELAAATAGIQWQMDENLREVERDKEGFIEENEVYIEMAKQYFRSPVVPFNWENRSDVEDRIRHFVGSMNANGVPTLVVSHGMILSTMLAPIFQIDPFEFWRDLDFGEVVGVESEELKQHWR